VERWKVLINGLKDEYGLKTKSNDFYSKLKDTLNMKEGSDGERRNRNKSRSATKAGSQNQGRKGKAAYPDDGATSDDDRYDPDSRSAWKPRAANRHPDVSNMKVKKVKVKNKEQAERNIREGKLRIERQNEERYGGGNLQDRRKR